VAGLRSGDDAKKVHDLLTKTKPVGGTNMYEAFEAAFKFRTDKLGYGLFCCRTVCPTCR